MNSLIPDLSNALFGAILHSIWQGCLAAVIYAICARRCSSSQTRYLLALGMFGFAVSAFIATFLVSFWSAPLGLYAAATQDVVVGQLELVFCIAWLLGAALAGCRYLGGWLWMRLVVVATAEQAPPALQALFAQSRNALHISRRVILRTSRLVTSPMVTGIVRPVVLLPIAMTSGVPESVLRAVFTHELLHLRRLDHIAVFVQAVGETLLFFHPAVRWLSEETRHARELRCDDESIKVVGDKYDYARALLAIEESRTANPFPALLMNGGNLMNRVERIFGKTTMKRSHGLNFFGMISFIAIALLGYSLSIGKDIDASTDAPTSSLTISWLPPAITQWQSVIEQAAATHDVPADVLALMIFKESAGDAKATSSGGARGLMQVMPKTGEAIARQRGLDDYSIEQLYDPAVSVDFGAWYLARQLGTFTADEKQSLALALSAYNAGPGAVRRYLADGKQLPPETIRYRESLLALWQERANPTSATIDEHLAGIRQRLPAFAMPVVGKLTSPFGFDGGDRGTHNGVDIAAPTGTPIAAPANGKVTATGEDEKRGKYVTLRHATGVESHYFHLHEIAVTAGASVSAGDTLGEVGNKGRSNGSHLHFEIREYGAPVSPALYGVAAN